MISNMLQHGEVRHYKAGDVVPWWIEFVTPLRWRDWWSWLTEPRKWQLRFAQDTTVMWEDFNNGVVGCLVLPADRYLDGELHHAHVRGGMTGRTASGKPAQTAWVTTWDWTAQ